MSDRPDHRRAAAATAAITTMLGAALVIAMAPSGSGAPVRTTYAAAQPSAVSYTHLTLPTTPYV